MRAKEITETRRPWRHFDAFAQGHIKLANSSLIVRARYAAGLVETGKSRTFAGYFVRVRLGDEEWVGQHPHSLMQAFYAAGSKCRMSGWMVDAVGLRRDAYQTGLSGNSTSVYLRGVEKRRFDMFEPTPLDLIHTGAEDRS